MMFREFLWTWVPWIFNKTTVILSKTHSLYRAIYNELMIKKEWIFIKNVEIPINSATFGTINNDTIEWRCTLCPATFTQPGTIVNQKEKHLSYLGFMVKIQATEIDLSDWVNEVKWLGSREPTVKEIFLLWSCESGESYFHCLDDIVFEVVTDMGDTLRINI